MGSIATVARFGERIGSKHGRALRGDGRGDPRGGIRIVEVAVVDRLIGAVTEKPEMLEA